jgi:hypothetical protein
MELKPQLRAAGARGPCQRAVEDRLQLLLLVHEDRASALYSSRMPAMTSSCMLHSAAFACTSACSSLQRGQSKQMSASASLAQEVHLLACHGCCLLAAMCNRRPLIWHYGSAGHL